MFVSRVVFLFHFLLQTLVWRVVFLCGWLPCLVDFCQILKGAAIWLEHSPEIGDVMWGWSFRIAAACGDCRPCPPVYCSHFSWWMYAISGDFHLKYLTLWMKHRPQCASLCIHLGWQLCAWIALNWYDKDHSSLVSYRMINKMETKCLMLKGILIELGFFSSSLSALTHIQCCRTPKENQNKWCLSLTSITLYAVVVHEVRN